MRRQRFDQINIVPFVDIVLVLLVIVLATATFLKQGSVPINLPEQNSTSSSRSKTTTISIDTNGSYYLDDMSIKWEELRSSIDSYDTNTTNLLLRTDKQTPFEYFSRLMMLLKEKGFSKISIATKISNNK